MTRLDNQIFGDFLGLGFLKWLFFPAAPLRDVEELQGKVKRLESALNSKNSPEEKPSEREQRYRILSYDKDTTSVAGINHGYCEVKYR